MYKLFSFDNTHVIVISSAGELKTYSNAEFLSATDVHSEHKLTWCRYQWYDKVVRKQTRDWYFSQEQRPTDEGAQRDLVFSYMIKQGV